MLVDQDIVRITLNQSITAVVVKNVFFFRISVIVAGITLLDLLDTFDDLIGVSIRAIQVAAATTNEAIAENLSNEIDIETLVISAPGTDVGGGAVQPSYVAARYTLNVADKTTRPGGKRFSGIGESRVLGNNYEPDATADADLVTDLEEPFTVTGTPTGSGLATQVIVGRDELGAIDLTRISVVASVTSQFFIGTQVSRRRGAL